MQQYLDALTIILLGGELVEDRTGVGTRSLIGYNLRFDLQQGFPAVTTKKLAWKSVVSELLWFLEGSTDERRLAEILYEDIRNNLATKRTIWTDNADNQGVDLGYVNTDMKKELGPVYGHQWRGFNKHFDGEGVPNGEDQINNIIKLIKTDPNSRRIILSAWNPLQIDNMALPPCHLLAQFFVKNNKLSCILYQRSADMFLGVPFNIASYSLLTHMLAKVCNLEADEFIWVGGDCHIYNNHIEQVAKQVKRIPKTLPTLKMPDIKDLEIETIKQLKTSDFILENYVHDEPIKAEMAI